MKAIERFKKELYRLVTFYEATIYFYDQTEKVISEQKKNKTLSELLSENGLNFIKPDFFKGEKDGNHAIRNQLREIIFVRLVSALEVFLIDQIRDVFIETKEPFKDQSITHPFSQAELLSYKTTTEFYNKVINTEIRKLSNGGFNDIVKYYNRHFKLDIGSFLPGKSKMEEYHDRRNLLVHTLGKTDQKYREKFNYKKMGVSVEENYFLTCLDDFLEFSDAVSSGIAYQLENEFTTNHIKGKKYENKLLIVIEKLEQGVFPFLHPNFEFWVDGELSSLHGILDSITEIGDNKTELIISGSNRQIKHYANLLKQLQKESKINILMKESLIQKKIPAIKKKKKTYKKKPSSTWMQMSTDEILDKIQQQLPTQPWQKGIHKIVAQELNLSNGFVNYAIQILIRKGIFKHQVDGVVIENNTPIKKPLLSEIIEKTASNN